MTQAAIEWLKHEEDVALKACRESGLRSSAQVAVEAGRSESMRYAASVLGEYEPKTAEPSTDTTFRDPADLEEIR